MHRLNPHSVAKRRPDGRNLLIERLQVVGHRLVAPRHLRMTGAKPAQPVAIGNVHIKRDRGSTKLRQPFSKRCWAYPGMEMRCGRVTGVARNGFAQSRDGVGVRQGAILMSSAAMRGSAGADLDLDQIGTNQGDMPHC